MTIRTLRGISAFLFAVGLGICALHAAITIGLRRIPTSMFGAWNLAASGQVNAGIVVAGSSRAVLHYDPTILARATGLTAFNVGRIGASAVSIHTGILRAYLRTNRRPRLLIENADLESLSAYPGIYDLPQYTPYLGDDGLYDSMRRRNPSIWKARWLPLYGYLADDVEYRHYLGVKALFGFMPVEDYQNGYLPHDVSWPNTLPKAPAALLHYEANPGGLQDFEELLAEARIHGVAAIVVFSPMYHELTEWVRGRETIMAQMASIANRQHALLWDYCSFSPVAASTEYFSDGRHMNRRGATVFSEALGQRIAAWLAQSHEPPEGRLSTNAR